MSLDMLLCACWKYNEIGVMQVFVEQMVEAGYNFNEMFQHQVLPLNFYAPEFVERVVGTWEPPRLPNIRSILLSLGLEDPINWKAGGSR